MGVQLKVGGKFHLKLNTGVRPIANKYCEGKMKRYSEKRVKIPEIVEKEAVKVD